jgi:serine phosphatase RsbU (regulator of sigma subunit)
MPVSFFRKRELPFTNHFVELRENEMIYLTTDGITDQFGGHDGKKFRQEAFRNLLVEIYSKPLDVQRDDIDRELSNWMGPYNQVDDILVVGWRVS